MGSLFNYNRCLRRQPFSYTTERAALNLFLQKCIYFNYEGISKAISMRVNNMNRQIIEAIFISSKTYKPRQLMFEKLNLWNV